MSEGPHRSPFMGHPMPSHSQAQSTSMFQPSGLHTGPPSADQIESLPATAMMMGPPARTSPEHDANGVYEHIGGDQPSSGSLAGPPNAAAAAAAGVQQPKVVQTAFIHKLYKYGSPSSSLHINEFLPGLGRLRGMANCSVLPCRGSKGSFAVPRCADTAAMIIHHSPRETWEPSLSNMLHLIETPLLICALECWKIKASRV